MLSIAICALILDSKFVPAETTVLILPTQNISGDKHEALKKEQIRESDDTLKLQFESRGFKVLNSEVSSKLILDAKIDLTDEENYRKDLFYDLGSKGNADIVVFNSIIGTRQQKRNDFFENLEGFATMRTWILGVKDKNPILKGERYEGTSAKNGSVGFGRQVRAVRIGLDKATLEFLKPYPVLIKK